jgi:hypothetical protein
MDPVAGDRKILGAANRLDTIEGVGRNFAVAEEIVLVMAPAVAETAVQLHQADRLRARRTGRARFQRQRAVGRRPEFPDSLVDRGLNADAKATRTSQRRNSRVQLIRSSSGLSIVTSALATSRKPFYRFSCVFL